MQRQQRRTAWQAALGIAVEMLFSAALMAVAYGLALLVAGGVQR